jgi:GT2 family glycosyltransferase
MTSSPPIYQASVVIPSWDGANLLDSTLERLTQVAGVTFEVLVVDHGRLNRKTEELLRRFSAHPWIRYVGEDEQLGYAGAVNRGVSLAGSNTVVVICNDVLVEKDWLKELLAAHERDRQAGKNSVLFSLVKRDAAKDPRKARVNFWFRILSQREFPAAEKFLFPDGSSFLFDRAAYGLPFDASYFLYQEDAYIGWRAWLRGEEVRIVPASRADNIDGGTTRRTPYRTSFLTERNRWINYFSFLSWGSLIKAAPVLFLDAWVKFIFGSNRLAKLHAWGWLLGHPLLLLEKRKKIQSERRRSDAEILPLFSSTFLDASPGHPLNRIFSFLVRLCGLPLQP